MVRSPTIGTWLRTASRIRTSKQRNTSTDLSSLTNRSERTLSLATYSRRWSTTDCHRHYTQSILSRQNSQRWSQTTCVRLFTLGIQSSDEKSGWRLVAREVPFKYHSNGVSEATRARTLCGEKDHSTAIGTTPTHEDDHGSMHQWSGT